jgi:hypothetical protein
MKTWYPVDAWMSSASLIFPFFVISVIVALKIIPSIMGSELEDEKFEFKTVSVLGRTSAFLVTVTMLTGGWLLCWLGLKQDLPIWHAAASSGANYGDYRTSPNSLIFKDLLMFLFVPATSWFLWVLTLWAFHAIDSFLRRVFRPHQLSPETAPKMQ